MNVMLIIKTCCDWSHKKYFNCALFVKVFGLHLHKISKLAFKLIFETHKMNLHKVVQIIFSYETPSTKDNNKTVQYPFEYCLQCIII